MNEGTYGLVDGLILLEILAICSGRCIVELFGLRCSIGMGDESCYPCSWDL